MEKWKPVVLNDDILSKGEGELIGLEELECPDDSLIIYGDQKKKQRNRKAKQEKKTGIKKKKQKNEQYIKKDRSVAFKGFCHHDKMMSWSTFGLRDEILAALYDKKFLEPTEIQLKCLGPAVCGLRDMLGAAETGSGKTLAFGIPIVNGILKLKDRQPNDDDFPGDSSLSEEDWEDETGINGCMKVKNIKKGSVKNNLYAVILTPTRELAIQVKDHLTDICKYTNIRVVLIVGGLASEKQERLLRMRPEIIVATPGRLWDLLQTRNNHLKNINKIKFLAIDETDRMLERGHFDELNKLLECINLNENEKNRRQNFVFSATLTLVHDPPSYIQADKRQRITPGQKLQALIEKIGIMKPKIVDITSCQITPENLKELKVICKFEEKDYYLHYFLKGNPGKTIIFCNSIGCVKRLANLLTIMEYKPLPLHANMIQKQRLRNLEKFRYDGSGILIATDVAARGLDIIDLVHVIHYQVPKTAESYVHRSGRTARRNKFGNVLLLIEPQEYKSYIKLIHALGRSNEIVDLEIDNKNLNRLKEIVHLARDIDQLMLAIKKRNSTSSWYMKAIKDMDLLLDEDEIPKQLSDEGSKRVKADLSMKQKKLKELLAMPHVSEEFIEQFPRKGVPSSPFPKRTPSQEAKGLMKPKKWNRK